MKLLFADSRAHIELAFSFGALAPFENYEHMEKAGWREVVNDHFAVFPSDEVKILTVQGEAPSEWLASVERMCVKHGVGVDYVDVGSSISVDNRIRDLLRGRSLALPGGGRTPRGLLSAALRMGLQAAALDARESIERVLHEAANDPDVITQIVRGQTGGLTYRGMAISAQCLQSISSDEVKIRLKHSRGQIEKTFSGRDIALAASRASQSMGVLQSNPARVVKSHPAKDFEARMQELQLKAARIQSARKLLEPKA